MFSPRWSKVRRDLWSNKTRTLLVIISIAVGVFAFGMIAGARTTLLREVNQGYLAINPASATLRTDAFDDELVEAVARMREVGEAEGRRSLMVRVKIGAAEWYDMQIIMIADYDDIRVSMLLPERGLWPPPERELLVERSVLPLINAHQGDVMEIELPDGKLRQMPIAGLAYDVSKPPGELSGIAYAYVTRDTLTWLGVKDNYDELLFTVAENEFDEAHIQQVASLVEGRLERSGREVYEIDIPTPGQHPVEEILPTMLLILGVMGVFALILSGFLVINTISAILTQQVRQIGIMKSMGARTKDVMAIYFSMVLAFGLLALLVAIPLGKLGADALSRFMSGFLNIDLQSTRIPPQVLAVEVLVGLLVPILASLHPIISSSNITVREAITDYGLGGNQYGGGMIDRFFKNMRGLPRPLMLSLRNTFRRQGRLARTLISMILGGAVFISVLTVRESLFRTLDETVAQQGFDVIVTLKNKYRTRQLEQQALRVPGVAVAESWGAAIVRRQRADGTESEILALNALPANSRIMDPVISRGDWLPSEPDRSIVVNANLLTDEPDLDLGSELIVNINGDDTTWQIVGITEEFQPPIAPVSLYVNYAEFTRLVGQVGRADTVRIATTQHDAAFQKQIARELEQHFENIGLRVRTIKTSADERESITKRFNILTSLLLTMSVLIAIVGGLGLMGTMSINVIERAREIGVMRAIGASDSTVIQIFIVEGTLIGLIAWTIGLLLSFPMSRFMSNQIGNALLRLPLFYTYSTSGAFLWLFMIIILAAAASFLPARHASQLTIREVLSYE
jgi:putative ABC transport system permease protein